MRDIALAYADGGAEVLPLHSPADTSTGCSCMQPVCAHPAKHPRTLHGLRDATTDPDRIRRWWKMWPAANIGIRPPAGQFVLDVDPRAGGFEQLAAMQDRYGALPTTRLAYTGGAGLHFWLRAPGEDFRRELAPGLDIKGHRGYVVAPPSVHISGRSYAWLTTGAVADAPDYLERLIIKPARPATSTPGAGITPAQLAGLVRTVSTAPQGKRNELLNWACWQAAQRGADLQPLVEAALLAGLTRDEAEATANSARKAAASQAVAA